MRDRGDGERDEEDGEKEKGGGGRWREMEGEGEYRIDDIDGNVAEVDGVEVGEGEIEEVKDDGGGRCRNDNIS